MKKIFFSFCLVSFVFCTDALAVTSPVVQVVSYKEPLWLYFSLQWWGSGSIIDSQWHIITNNHVVDDGVGGVSDDFAVCITENPSLPPKCHYTASVVTRDVDADVAVLQLDSTDIFGNKVDFNALSTLTMDTNYIPQSGDTVTARGYPWVWANTITETQGIVSGTAQHNEHTYIKTDTLIAGGNSGGPLIRGNTMIGINTFLIGWGYDPSLGYSLLISEVKNFIQNALALSTRLQSNNVLFSKFLQKIETFSAQKKITDPLISIGLPANYTLLSYVPATSFSASLSDTDATSVSSFSFYHMRTPKIHTTKELQSYLSTDLGAPTDTSLQSINIGGKQFYEFSFDTNLESNKTRNTYIYFMVVDDSHLLFLYLQTPVPTKNTLEKIQQSVKNFLADITFPSTFIFPTNTDIRIASASIALKPLPNSFISYDITEYRWLLLYSIIDKQDFVLVRNYLGNLWSKAEIAVFKNSFETEDDSIDTWISHITEWMYAKPLVKKKVVYNGHPWFLICTGDVVVDEIGKNNDIIRCEAIFLIGDHNQYIVSSQMSIAKKELPRIDALMIQYLDQSLQITRQWDTVFNTEKRAIPVPYSDVWWQNTAYQEALKTLLSYGILQNRPRFEWDAPLRWNEYFSLYIWAVYHKRMTDMIDPNNPQSPTFKKALSVLPIAMEDYAEDDEWQLDKIDNLIRLLVAGGSLPKYDFDTIYDFSNATSQDEWPYQDAWNQIATFENTYFPHRNLMQSAKYISNKTITYNPFTDLVIKPKEEVSFFRNNAQKKIELDKSLRCERDTIVYFSAECRDIRKKTLLESFTYAVLTKGKAIEDILWYIDTSLWVSAESK